MSYGMSDTTTPIVIDLGKQKRKQLKALKKGEGKLVDEVYESIQQVGHDLGVEAQGKAIVPIVVIYERKTKRRTGFLPFKI